MDDNSIDRNIRVWDGAYDWEGSGRMGENWSNGWGNSTAQWYVTLYPRIARYLPSGSILEIAPGFGRWTRFLLPLCDRLVGVDVSRKCINFCTQHFANHAHATFLVNDGKSLNAVANESIDFCFSFDSLVHVNAGVLEGYVRQILDKLRPGGVAFIHHSNLASVRSKIPLDAHVHWRAADVSADLVRDLIVSEGGSLVLQELHVWASKELIDCMTIFGREPEYIAPLQRVENYKLATESQAWREMLAKAYFDDSDWPPTASLPDGFV